MSKSKKNGDKKPKKEKIVYVDDGSTVVDMSGVGRQKRMQAGEEGADHRSASPKKNGGKRVRATWREQFQTYVAAVKMMFFPMLVVLAILAVTFLILYLLFI